MVTPPGYNQLRQHAPDKLAYFLLHLVTIKYNTAGFRTIFASITSFFRVAERKLHISVLDIYANHHNIQKIAVLMCLPSAVNRCVIYCHTLSFYSFYTVFTTVCTSKLTQQNLILLTRCQDIPVVFMMLSQCL